MTEDLFKAAGLHQQTSRRKKKSGRLEAEQGQGEESGEEAYGGHNLRTVIGERHDDGISVTYRPRSLLAKPGARGTLERALASDNDARKRAKPDLAPVHDDDEEDDVGEDDVDDDMSGSDDEDEEDSTDMVTSQKVQSKPHVRAPSPSNPPTTITTKTVQPFALSKIANDSCLSIAAAEVFSDQNYSLNDDLSWQAKGKGDATEVKSFRIEVTQQVDVVAFAYMRPASVYVQILHSLSTYAVRGSGSEWHGHDFGFIGDRTALRIPMPVMIEEKLWKWFTKKLGMDVPPIQGYYAKPENKKRLYYDDASGGSPTAVPRMLYLPPPFLVYCLEQPRTPFELHGFVAQYATRDGTETSIQHCTLIMDWCIVATQTAAAASPTTSMLALNLPTAPSDDEAFVRWLYKIDRTRTSEGGGHDATDHGRVSASTVLPTTTPVAGAPATSSVPMPAQDVWERMATNISSSFASAAAAWKPPQTEDADITCDTGGRNYDKFQMAVVQGFAHAPSLDGPQWASPGNWPNSFLLMYSLIAS